MTTAQLTSILWFICVYIGRGAGSVTAVQRVSRSELLHVFSYHQSLKFLNFNYRDL
jgi:hypothetical protein